MAKETVGVRVPVAIAEQVDRYAEIHEITRTDAMELFIRTGILSPWGFREKRVYTGRIREDWHPSAPHRRPNGSKKRDDSIARRVRRKLGGSEAHAGEWEENTALTARLPSDLVWGIEEWGKSHDMSKSVAAEDLLTRGLRSDPLPDTHTIPLEGETYTVELEPVKADLFRRYRLSHWETPSEAVSGLLAASRSKKPITVDWANPDKDGA